ncbi:uncharacterized protein MONBRDRAFT_35477 [Monosiga brevicollis MX1]|uniref:Uncharacterized protein n=1 Tax=Monosiga brevicollis TaxID=81824 RepID=A9UPB6_MONBE|nr:uncharacterized protein MONBRDRAFT_35477 [Monosiga brevicollis MX1]EDQ92848.1 predicted protein [Monosiga brevicollis MX1]|eukprot:XP_001742610.1 hypothetical protein [Monosiga brevicollis MX1]
MFKLCMLAAATLALAAAQDPAEGWMGYAKGVSPRGTGVITHAEAKWKVLSKPNNAANAFYSPWFGIESSDNLNLIQPVNPWTGRAWQMYIEYFQWEPEHNENSQGHIVSPGDVLHGVIDLDQSSQTYIISHTNLNTGWNVKTQIPVQRKLSGEYKEYTILYFVFEKTFACHQYPAEEVVTFYDIAVQYDNQTVAPTWTTAYVDDNCNNRAHILNETTISITWDTSM